MNITYKIRDDFLPYFKDPINQSVLEEWALALCSGEYEQTYGKLHCLGGFCCLGVAEAAVNKHDPKILFNKPSQKILRDSGKDVVQLHCNGKKSIYLEDVLIVCDQDPMNIGIEKSYSFIYLNDNLQLNFQQIGMLITNHEVTVPYTPRIAS